MLSVGLWVSIQFFSATAFAYAVSGRPLRSRAVYSESAPDWLILKSPNFALMALVVNELNEFATLTTARAIVAYGVLNAKCVECGLHFKCVDPI
jgi:hypothetical protein